jgi:DNA-directed RNA polymerase subunit RPC12/RpoP
MKKEPAERTICPVCKGAKVVKVKEDEKSKEIPCPRCGGRGYI